MSKMSAHIGSDLLLGYLDGELSRRAASRVAAHLESCWSCRVRLAEIEEAITAVVRRRDWLAQRRLPPESGRRAQFIARLNHLAVSRPARRRFPVWPAWVAAAATVAVLTFHWLTRPPSVSAAVLLQRAAKSEAAVLTGVLRPVVRQTVEMRAGTRRFRRTIYRDTTTRRVVNRWQTAADVSLETAFRSAGVPWDDPLSASAYEEWRRVQQVASERMTSARLPDGADAVVLTTSTNSTAPVAEASLVVRTGDWHPVRRTFRLRNAADGPDFDCTEISFSVVPLDRIEPGVFVEPPPVVAAPPAPKPATPAVGLRAPAEPSLDLQVGVLYRLHLAGACLGEAIEMSAAGDAVHVAGRVDGEQRKLELLAALADLPGVQTDIRTFEEMTVVGEGTKTTLAIESESVPVKAALQAYFEQSFSPKDAAKAVASLSDEAVDASRAMLQHAWSLRRLAERFQANQAAALSERSSLELERMISDHRHELSRRIATELHLLTPLFQAFPIEPLPTAAWEPGELAWPGSGLALFGEIEKIDHLQWQLFAGPESTGAELPEISHDLYARLEGLRLYFAGHGTEIRLDRRYPR